MKNFFAKSRMALGKKRGRHVTQREIGDAMGVTDKAVGLWETEVNTPPISRSADLARVYEVEPSVIHKEIAELAARIAKRRAAQLVA